MARFLDPCLLGALALLAGCSEAAGPETGRWAATEIELTVSPSSAEFRLACAAPARLGPGLTDSVGRIRFSTPIQPLWGVPFQVDFVGQTNGDWLFATMTRTFTIGPPVVQQYVLLRDGDAGFDKVACPD
jgi:hypothetical protein